MAEDQQAPLFLVKPEAARVAFEKLAEAKVHPTFVGYLCVKRTARSQGRTQELRPNFKALFDDFLAVSDAPERSPYLVPFADSKGDKWSPFFNRNVAGSYAPASLRDVSPFRRVVDISGSRKAATFSLAANHPTLALKHLLFEQPLGAAALSMFLYRDYGLQTSAASVRSVIDTFRDEFGYRPEVAAEDEEFKLLYRNDEALFKSDSFKMAGSQ